MSDQPWGSTCRFLQAYQLHPLILWLYILGSSGIMNYVMSMEFVRINQGLEIDFAGYVNVIPILCNSILKVLFVTRTYMWLWKKSTTHHWRPHENSNLTPRNRNFVFRGWVSEIFTIKICQYLPFREFIIMFKRIR